MHEVEPLNLFSVKGRVAVVTGAADGLGHAIAVGLARAGADDPANANLVATVLHGIPMGRMGEPHEMVGPVLFLASDAAAMVTGVVLPVDGGNLAMNAGAGGWWPTRSR